MNDEYNEELEEKLSGCLNALYNKDIEKLKEISNDMPIKVKDWIEKICNMSDENLEVLKTSMILIGNEQVGEMLISAFDDDEVSK